MSIFDDVRAGILDRAKLDEYVRNDPGILERQEDPGSGWTPLATAAAEGFPNEVEQLLKKGAKADGRCRDGETPLLVAAWQAKRERPLIVQLLLAKTPAGSVDATATSSAAGAGNNKTALMWAVEKGDVDSVRLLRRANASDTAVDGDSKRTVRKMAEDSGNAAVVRALNPDDEPSALAKFSATIVAVLLYIVAWINGALDELVRRASGLNPVLNDNIDRRVNDSGDPTKDQFVKNVDKFVKGNPTLERFFGDKKDYIQQVAQNAANLWEEDDSDLGDNDLFPKTVKVSLHQQVIYCDDSTSMKRQSRWENQKKLVRRIAEITTRVLPEGEGVALRFINRDVAGADNLSLEEIGKIMDPMPWQPGGDTPIGTSLRSKILEPLVYAKLDNKELDRPLLISIMTDGMPEPEDKSKLADTIVECGQMLDRAKYPRDTVKFMIGQIGTANSATKFLESLRDNDDIAPVTFVTSDRLDESFSKFHANDQELDRWLVETLFGPLKDAETKKDQ